MSDLVNGDEVRKILAKANFDNWADDLRELIDDIDYAASGLEDEFLRNLLVRSSEALDDILQRCHISIPEQEVDWLEDSQMRAEETMRRFISLKSEPSGGATVVENCSFIERGRR